MMAKLDEIEKVCGTNPIEIQHREHEPHLQTLAQFSPRKLAIEDLSAETPTGMPSIASLTPSPKWRGSPSGTPAPMASPQPGLV